MTVLFLALLASAQEVDGFAELRLTAYAGVDAEVPLLMVERVRPTFTAPIAERVFFSTTIEAGLGQGWTMQRGFSNLVDAHDLSPVVADALGGSEHDNELLGVSVASDYLAVDRLTLQIQLKALDITIGRQALNWGSGFAVNPSDPFPEVLLTEPWKPRSGMNAVRFDIPVGDLSGIQLVAGSDDAFEHPRLAGRATANWVGADWSLVGAWRQEIDEGIVGADVKGTLGVGFWFEGVVHIGNHRDPWEELVVGVDYSLPIFETVMLTAQYYRNGSSAGEASASAVFAPREPFAAAFAGRDYAMLGVGGGLTPDVSTNLFWLQNLNDGSAFFVPSVSVIVSDTVDISLAGQVPLALIGGGEFKPAADDLVVPMPASDGSLVSVDLGGLVPDATVILWTRFNF